MSDDWEDWEEESFAPAALKAPSIPADKTKGDLLLAKQKEIDVSKFAGEDEGEEEEPAWQKHIPTTQQVRPQRNPKTPCIPGFFTAHDASSFSLAITFLKQDRLRAEVLVQMKSHKLFFT